MAQSPQAGGIEYGSERRKRNRPAGFIEHRIGNSIQILQFTGGLNLRVAGQNLLDERAAGSGHADDEDGNGRGVADPGKAVQQVLVEPLGDGLEGALISCFIVRDFAALESIALEKMLEGTLVVARVFEALPSAKWT